MTLDVSTYREQGLTVLLPPEVTAVRFRPYGADASVEVGGDRRKLARILRTEGYTVVWDDPNPAVALASRTSQARAAASRVNGALSGGTPRSVAKLCPEPLKTSLMNLDKGTLTDIIYVAAQMRVADAMAAMRATRAARDEMPEVEP
jgi:hypothetical protein